MKNAVLLAGCLLFLFAIAAHASEDEFPLRKEFSELNPITIEDLHEKMNETVIVDVRSKFEFDTIHINGSEHIPVSNIDFSETLEKVVPKGQKTAFYCNGHTCAKSYKAARKALLLCYENVFVFDAGIFEWAKAHPEEATFLEKSPADREKLLLAKEDFSARALEFADFKNKTSATDVVIVDIREPYQRSKESDRSVKIELPEMPAGIHYIPLDNFNKLTHKGIYKDKLLLIYDATGKQVKWLQYHLQDAGYKRYYFLKGGVYGVTGISTS